MSPPGEPSGDFVAHMEDVLEVYHRPYNESKPVVCLDEVPEQLVSEVRLPAHRVQDGRPVTTTNTSVRAWPTCL